MRTPIQLRRTLASLLMNCSAAAQTAALSVFTGYIDPLGAL